MGKDSDGILKHLEIPHTVYNYLACSDYGLMWDVIDADPGTIQASLSACTQYTR